MNSNLQSVQYSNSKNKPLNIFDESKLFLLISFAPSSGIGFYELEHEIYQFDLVTEEYSILLNEPARAAQCMEYDQIKFELYFDNLEHLISFTSEHYLRDKKNTYYSLLFTQNINKDLFNKTLILLNDNEFQNVKISKKLIPILKETAKPELIISVLQISSFREYNNVKKCLAEEFNQVILSNPVIIEMSNIFPSYSENVLTFLSEYIEIAEIIPESYNAFETLFGVINHHLGELNSHAFDLIEKIDELNIQMFNKSTEYEKLIKHVKRLNDPLEEYIQEIMGDDYRNSILVMKCIAAGIITNEEISETTNLKPEVVSRILLKLNYAGIASYKKIRDPETQQDVYRWDLRERLMKL